MYPQVTYPQIFNDKIALFGCTGMLGSAILKVLLNPVTPGFKPTVYAFVSPSRPHESVKNLAQDSLVIVEVEYSKGGPEVVEKLRGIDTVVSALSGGAQDFQYPILDAAAEAGVKRFMPSEYGFHHLYRTKGDKWAYVHPLWDEKERFLERLKLHPAVDSGKMCYVIVNCGDLFNQASEKFWFPWMDKHRESYEFCIVGDGDAPVDWSTIEDLAAYVSAALAHPETTVNRTINVPSVRLSQNGVVDALRRRSGRPVTVQHVSTEDAQRFGKNPELAPAGLKANTRYPLDFWWIVKSILGQGLGIHPRPEMHHALFPEVKPTTFDEFFAKHFAS